MLWEGERHIAEYEGGWLFITEVYGGKEYPVKLLNNRGQCITRGQFRDACKTHGVDRACDTFKKLAAETPPYAHLMRQRDYSTDLTAAGEQTVIPGCERNASPRATQLDLFG